MSLRTVFYFALAVFLILYGLFAVTNLQVEWGKQILGFSALIAGVLCAVIAFKAAPP